MLLHENHSLDDNLKWVQAELKRATVDRKHPFRYTVLSTQSNQLRSRYVVLREITPSFECIMYTDSRSRKVIDLSKNRTAQLLFYHPKQQLQLILTGSVSIFQNDERAKEAWQKVQGYVQQAYNSVQAPGTPIHEPKEGHVYKEPMDDEYFAVLALDPTEIEVLQLNRSGHLRALFTKENAWKGQWLVP